MGRSLTLLLGVLLILETGGCTAANPPATEKGAVPAAGSSPAAVTAYPAPPEATLSADYELKVNSTTVPVYQCRVSAVPYNQIWHGPRPLDQTELAGFAYWDMAGPVDVEVVVHRPIKTAAVRPSARGLKPVVDGQRLRFRLDRPGQVTVEVNGYHQALHLFANPPQAGLPGVQEPGVRYFGPGVHRVGKITLASHETLVIAGGAVVYGAITASGATDVRILGHGVLDTSDFGRGRPGGGSGCLRLTDCRNVTVDGLILRDSSSWCFSLFGCTNVAISNVKVVGQWSYGTDGIDVCNCEDVTIRDSFIRSFDDSIVVKGLQREHDLPVHRVLAERCVLWNDWGRALEIGAETSTPEMTDLTFRDCDIIHTNCVAMEIQHSDRAAIRRVLFENIRLEIDDVPLPPRLQKTPQDVYPPLTRPYCPSVLVAEIFASQWGKDQERGTVDGLTVRNITVTGRPPVPPPPPAAGSTEPPWAWAPSRLAGFDATHRISGVTIENLRINGRVMQSLEEAHVTVAPFVDNMKFSAR